MSFIAKKSLGQNFLNAPHIADMMVKTLGIKTSDTVFEVGPGKGALTSVLLKDKARVIAIEKDIRSVEFLQQTFHSQIKDENFWNQHINQKK